MIEAYKAGLAYIKRDELEAHYQALSDDEIRAEMAEVRDEVRQAAEEALVTLADPNRQTIEVTHLGSGVSAYATIPVRAGVIDHFDIGINNRSNPTPNDVLEPIPDHRAGSSLPNVTIIARDIFGNHINDYAEEVNLFVSHGTGILTPTVADLGAGMGGSFQGAWRGPIQITRTGIDVRLFVREETYALTDSSNTFDVFADEQDYAVSCAIPTDAPGLTYLYGRQSSDTRARDGDEIEVILLAGYLRLIPPVVVQAFPKLILNIHPALLPAYPGLNTHQRVLDAGDQWHGSTVHFVTEELDAGPRIMQGRLPVIRSESAEQLAARVQVVEHQIYPQSAVMVGEGRVRFRDGKTWIDGRIAEQPIVQTYDETGQLV